jgi:hypothetical protein
VAVASNRQGQPTAADDRGAARAVLTTNGAAGAAAVDRGKPADDVQAAWAELGPGGALIVRAMVTC